VPWMSALVLCILLLPFLDCRVLIVKLPCHSRVCPMDRWVQVLAQTLDNQIANKKDISLS
jgi:hypothetical protein